MNVTAFDHVGYMKIRQSTRKHVGCGKAVNASQKPNTTGFGHYMESPPIFPTPQYMTPRPGMVPFMPGLRPRIRPLCL